MTSTIYGALLSEEDVRLALVAHLETWTPAYIAEVGRQRGVTLPEFRGFAMSADDTFPVCITACAGTDGGGVRHGDGTVTASYAAAAAAVVAGDTREEATALASYYGAAIRAAILQHPDLSGFAAEVEWTGGALEEVAFDTGKAIVASLQRFTITVDNVLNVQLGPADPPVNPTASPGDAPVVGLVVEGVVRDATEDD